VTDVDDWSDPTADGWEPDPSDYGEARAEEEYWQHCDEMHSGKHCDCPQPELEAGDPGQPFATEPPF
jgi:hypothetical protein